MVSVDECIGCGTCRRNCEFLTKYNLDFTCREALYELAYHCFLCGKCNEVCPMDIDGKGYILELRRQRTAKNGGKIPEDGYADAVAEKMDYALRDYKDANTEVVFFPGCNFPAVYPETTRIIYQILKDKAGAGIAVDCCGLPISDLGLLEDEERIVTQINAELKAGGVKELVVACVNCDYFLTDRLDIKVTSVFEKLKELGVGKKIEVKDMKLFLPCSDRVDKRWLAELAPYLPEDYEIKNPLQCCGLGGAGKVKEAEIYDKFSSQFRDSDDKNVFAYCASCAGVFTKAGTQPVRHVLTEILETYEEANTEIF
jgi:fumarate reductase (CoM/CoB) subunit B